MKKMKKSELYEVHRELEDLALEMNYVIDGVVVEGPHDKKALKLLGYEGPIITCSVNLSQPELVEFLAKSFSRIAILTDFDEEGENLSKKLTRLLESRRVKVERLYRRKFKRLLKKARLSTIESIYRIKLELFN